METEELELEVQDIDTSETETEEEATEIMDADFIEDPFLCDECQQLGYCRKGREEAIRNKMLAELIAGSS